MQRLTTALLLASLAGCSEPCAGLECGPCPPALSLTIDAADGAAVTVDGDVALDCAARGATTACVSHDDVAPGAYAFTIRAPGFTTRDVTLTVGPGGSGCCSCAVEAAHERVDLTATDAGTTSADAGTTDAGTTDAGATTHDAGTAASCRPERVEFPMGGDLSPGTLCDDVFVCVIDEAQASAVEAASSSFQCSADSGAPCGGGLGCAFRDPGGPSTLDESEIQSICAVTLLEPPPERIVCVVYL